MHRYLVPLALATAGCGYQSISSPSHSALAEFQAATLIPMTNPAITDQTKRAWDYTLQLSAGITARVTATGWIGGRFLVQYSDEPTPRVASVPGDYVYPSGMRINIRKKILFCLAQGYRPVGNTPVTLLFIYDIQRRELIQTYDIKKGLIPNL